VPLGRLLDQALFAVPGYRPTMRVDDDPVGVALAAWQALTPRERREVDHQARRGRQHAEPRVADVAEAWAKVIVERQESRGFLGNALLSGPAFSDLLVSDLRLARKLLLIAAPSGEQ
jgi:hypothetical protein